MEWPLLQRSLQKMVFPLLLLLSTSTTISPTGLSPPLTGPICSIVEHGAIADNKTLSTAAIQATIDACYAAHPDGSTVIVPSGAYKTAGVLLRSNMRFHLERGAGLSPSFLLYAATPSPPTHIPNDFKQLSLSETVPRPFVYLPMETR